AVPRRLRAHPRRRANARGGGHDPRLAEPPARPGVGYAQDLRAGAGDLERAAARGRLDAGPRSGRARRPRAAPPGTAGDDRARAPARGEAGNTALVVLARDTHGRTSHVRGRASTTSKVERRRSKVSGSGTFRPSTFDC